MLAAKPLLGLLGALLGLLHQFQRIRRRSSSWSGIFVVLLGYFIPDLLLYSKGQERQKAMQLELANTLDQMLISVEAGLGFEGAMARAGENGKGPLAEELVRTLQDMQVGRSRRESYLALAERTNIPELRSFVQAVVQADTYGIAISRVLRIQAKVMRVKRRQRAEEKAMKLPSRSCFRCSSSSFRCSSSPSWAPPSSTRSRPSAASSVPHRPAFRAEPSGSHRDSARFPQDHPEYRASAGAGSSVVTCPFKCPRRRRRKHWPSPPTPAPAEQDWPRRGQDRCRRDAPARGPLGPPGSRVPAGQPGRRQGIRPGLRQDVGPALPVASPASLDSGDEAAALDAVLSLKTSSAMVGGVRLAELAGELEDAIRVGDADRARLLLREVAESGNETVDELQLSYIL